MRKVVIVAALMLSACSPNKVLENAPVIGSVCAAADGTLIDEKVVYAAEVLYNIPAQAYKAANENGQLTPAMKAALKPKLIKLNDLRLAVVAAKGSINCDFNSMKELQVEVLQLLPRK